MEIWPRVPEWPEWPERPPAGRWDGSTMSSLVVPEQGAHVTGCVHCGAVIVGRVLVPSVPGDCMAAQYVAPWISASI